LEGPSSVAGSGGGPTHIDLRGMSPEDVANLARFQLSYSNMLNNRSENITKAKAVDLQRQFENTLKILQERRAAQKEANAESSVKYSSPYWKDGKSYRDVYNAQGKIIKTEDLGTGKPSEDRFNTYVDPVGNLHQLDTSKPIPAGWKLATKTPTELTPGQIEARNFNLAKIDNMIATGVDPNKNDIDLTNPASISGYIDIYNRENPNAKYLMIPKKSWWGKTTPTLTKVSLDDIAKLPDNIINPQLPINPKTGQRFTMDQIRGYAQRKGVPVTVVLQAFFAGR